MYTPYTPEKFVKDWVCGQCGEELGTYAEFVEHVRNVHDDLNREGMIFCCILLLDKF
jgi:hypothetical protein